MQGTTWLAMGESKVLDLTIAPASAVRSPDVKHGLFISRKFKHKLEYWIIPQLKVKLLLAEDDWNQQRKPSRLVERRALRSHKYVTIMNTRETRSFQQICKIYDKLSAQAS